MSGSWRWVTDGGLETDLIFHRGVELRELAAYPLVRSPDGRDLLRAYYEGYAEIAETVGAGLRLEAPTWRANPDWAARLGDGSAALDAVNRAAVEQLRELAGEWSGRVEDTTVAGIVGPRGDGYARGEAATAEEAAEYHAPQVAAFAAAGADEVVAMTIAGAAEALGIAWAAESAGVPAVISFTVETDGRLADGSALAEAVRTVDRGGRPAYFMVSCAHPAHVLPAVAGGGDWLERIRGMRCNASTLSHAELDEAETLDEGDLGLLVSAHRQLEQLLPALEVVGGCCGTDARHVAALWGLGLSAAGRTGTTRGG
ncbi:MAG TPA: homocysteine S-methyltransferase family protein [Nocardioides sp.]|uniref:homocysteine S-methyltransferase family protein n=1 Tax=Nocardioides sp. TaxID=35761 RepID=UPI002E380B21|nr:homocysteine S-methyltransferase family protein [Nocardioides sp.]HEX3930220.1 homocysteine S-methyltransferase family protein [Nocardioides sp.]